MQSSRTRCEAKPVTVLVGSLRLAGRRFRWEMIDQSHPEPSFWNSFLPNCYRSFLRYPGVMNQLSPRQPFLNSNVNPHFSCQTNLTRVDFSVQAGGWVMTARPGDDSRAAKRAADWAGKPGRHCGQNSEARVLGSVIRRVRTTVRSA